MEPWQVLGIEPTDNRKAVKKAYSKKLKTCSPEKDPEAFMLLRNAYETVLVALDSPLSNDVQNEMPTTSEAEKFSVEYGNQQALSESQQSEKPDVVQVEDAFQKVKVVLADIDTSLKSSDEKAAYQKVEKFVESDDYVNLQVAENFKIGLVKIVLDIDDLKMWPAGFVSALDRLFNFENGERQSGLINEYLSHCCYMADCAVYEEESLKREKRQAIYDNVNECCERLTALMHARNDAEALSYFNRDIKERFTDNRFKTMFISAFVPTIFSIPRNYWPKETMLVISKDCELTAGHRYGSEYKDAIDYIRERQQSERLFCYLLDLQGRMGSEPAEYALALLFSKKGITDNVDDLSLKTDREVETDQQLNPTARLRLNEVLQVIDKTLPAIWNYELSEVNRIKLYQIAGLRLPQENVNSKFRSACNRLLRQMVFSQPFFVWCILLCILCGLAWLFN